VRNEVPHFSKISSEAVATVIALAIKYLNTVIPAKAGIQKGSWMPEQARHDEFGNLVARLI